MEFQKVIETRRTIRRFKSKEVKSNIIDKIINNGSLAPSSKNRQPWKFIVLKGEKKIKVTSLMIDWVHNHTDENSPSIIYTNSVYKSAIALSEAPVLILVFKKDIQGNEYPDLLSLGACMENMFLSAVDLKLGALWSTDILFAEKEIKDYLNITNLELISAIAIGYPDENPLGMNHDELDYQVLEK